MLDSLTVGVILLSASGHVVTTNPAAKRLLADGGLLEGRFGLRAERADESARLQQLIAKATAVSAGAGLGPAGSLTISRTHGSPLQLVVSPVRGLDA